MDKKRKLIELIIDETADMFGVEAISVVKFPAIESNFVFFNQDFLSLAKDIVNWENEINEILENYGNKKFNNGR